MIASWRGKIGWKGAIAIALGCLLAARLSVLFGPEDDDWQLIRSYSGTLDPAEGPISAKVFSFTYLQSSVFSRDTTLQNRIEVQSSDGSVRRFAWPSADAAGNTCDVVDLDGDGSREFVIATKSWARVVSYRKGKFTYRERSSDGNGGDDLSSATDLEMIDLDHDGRTEFIVFWHTSLEAIGKEPPRPELHQWTLRTGFQRGPDSLVEIYRNRLRTEQKAVGKGNF